MARVLFALDHRQRAVGVQFILNNSPTRVGFGVQSPSQRVSVAGRVSAGIAAVPRPRMSNEVYSVFETLDETFVSLPIAGAVVP